MVRLNFRKKSFALMESDWELRRRQTGNIWWPNRANVEVSGLTDQTQMKQLIQAAQQAWYARPHKTCLIRDGPNEQNIAHQTRGQKKCFKLLIECLMAFKFYQTRPNTIKQYQARYPNRKMFGHQTKFDGVWSPNISRLSRPLGPSENGALLVSLENVFFPSICR